MSKTRSPSRAAATARLRAIVLFPSPAQHDVTMNILAGRPRSLHRSLSRSLKNLGSEAVSPEPARDNPRSNLAREAAAPSRGIVSTTG